MLAKLIKGSLALSILFLFTHCGVVDSNPASENIAVQSTVQILEILDERNLLTHYGIGEKEMLRTDIENAIEKTANRYDTK